MNSMGAKFIPVLLGLFLLSGLFASDYIRFFDGKLHVIFCSVGQGDAIFIRTPGRKNILLDGGPDTSVLSCLSEHMPFWDRTIQLMIVSHPHEDHFAGMLYVIDRYDTKYFVTEELDNPTAGYNALQQKLSDRHIPQKYVFAGDQFRLSDGVAIEILGPSKKYLHETSPNGIIGERAEFASLVTKISFKDFDALLTGDSQTEGLQKISQSYFHGIEVLQAPHHGSRSGLDKNMIRLISPKVAVISVGKNNYGHPSKEILQLFHDANISVMRTDQKGDVEIVSDGKEFLIR